MTFVFPLRPLAEIVRDGGFMADGDWIESKDQDPHGEMRLIQLADIGDGHYVNKSSRFLTRPTAERLRCTVLNAGDILIARMPDPIGRACVFPGDSRPAITVVDVCIVRVDPKKVEPIWLKNAVNSNGVRADIERAAGGTTRTRVSRGSLEQLSIPTPPLAEQREIAAILTAVDDKLDVIARKISATKTLRQGLMQTLFSRGVGTQAADGRWVPHTEFKDSELGTVPTNWIVRSIGQMLEVVERPFAMVDDQRYRRVTVKRRHGGVELRDELPGVEIKVKTQFQLKAGDFLISERQIVHGACGIVPTSLEGALVSNEYLVLQAREGFDVRYFNYLVQQLRFAKLFLMCSQGVDIEKFLFKPADWLKKSIPVPPLAEQTRIAEVLATIEHKVAALMDRQCRYQTLKRGLMQKLLTGEWRVKVDEPEREAA